MAFPSVQLPTPKWAEQGTPLTDAAGLFLAAQEQSARRRLAEQKQAEDERAQRNIEERDSRRIGDMEAAHADALAQQKLANERDRETRNLALTREVNPLLETDPSAAAALAKAGGGGLAPANSAADIPPVAVPPGADAVDMMLSQSPGALTKPELRTATGEAKAAAKAQYPGANLMRMDERAKQQPGMEPTNIEESLMLAAIGKNRTPEQDVAIGATRSREQAVEAAKASDVGKYNLTLPGATEPLPLIAGAGRLGRESVSQSQRDVEAERIGAMGDSIIASLHTGQETPTEMQQEGILAADFKAIQGLVKSGALDVEQATKQLNVMIARRDMLGIWGMRTDAMRDAARSRGASTPPKPSGTDELPLTREARMQLDSLKKGSDYKALVSSYNNYSSILSDLNSGNDALIRRGIGLYGKEASGGSSVVTENELKRYVDQVGGKWNEVEKSWRTLVQTNGDTTGIPPDQLKIFQQALSLSLVPRAAAKLNTVKGMVKKHFANQPNVGLRKYGDVSVEQLISPAEGGGGEDPNDVLGGLGL